MIIDLARHDGETEISKNRSRSVWKDEAAEMLLIVRFQSPLGQKSGPVHNLRSTFSRTRNSEARTFDGTNGGSGVLHALWKNTREEGRKKLEKR